MDQGRKRSNGTTSPDHHLLMFLFTQKRFVLAGRHQLFHFSRRTEIDNRHPPLAIGIGIDDLRMVLEIGIDLRDGSADRRIDRGGGFSGLHFADLLTGCDLGTDLCKVDEDDVAQRILREMTDANCRLGAFGTDPLMFLVVAKIRRYHDSPLG